MPLFNSPEENVSKVETNIEAFATPPPHLHFHVTPMVQGIPSGDCNPEGRIMCCLLN